MFTGSAFGQISLNVGVQIDRKSKLSIGPEELSALGFIEIIFWFHVCDS